MLQWVVCERATAKYFQLNDSLKTIFFLHSSHIEYKAEYVQCV